MKHDFIYPRLETFATCKYILNQTNVHFKADCHITILSCCLLKNGLCWSKTRFAHQISVSQNSG